MSWCTDLLIYKDASNLFNLFILRSFFNENKQINKLKCLCSAWPLLVTSQDTSKSSRSSTGSSSSSQAGSTPLRDVMDKDRGSGMVKQQQREWYQPQSYGHMKGEPSNRPQVKVLSWAERRGSDRGRGKVHTPFHPNWTNTHDCEMSMNESTTDMDRKKWLLRDDRFRSYFIYNR